MERQECSGGGKMKYDYNDTIMFLAQIASKKFGGVEDGTFSSANFSWAVSSTTGLPALDGEIVAMILSGRDKIRPLNGRTHWKIIADE